LSLAPDEYAGLVMALLRFLAFPADGAPRAPAAPVTPSHSISPPLTGARAGSGGGAAPLLARRAEHLAVQAPAPGRPAAAARAVPVPVPVPVPVQTSPAAPPSVSSVMVVPAAAITAPAPAPTAQRLAVEEPPPWMDDAPFEDEAPFLAAAASADAPDPDPVGAQSGRPVSARDIIAPAPAASLPVAVTRTALGDRWAALVAELNAQGAVVALARELAQQAELTAVTPEGQPPVWQLTVQRESLRSAPLLDKLQAALRPLVAADLRLEARPGVAQDSPARRDAEAAALRQQAAEELVHNDPAVCALLAQFRTACILPGSIKPV
jgi:DNA polymerase III subunit gamma/tau